MLLLQILNLRHRIPLAPNPHFNPLAEYLRRHDKRTGLFIYYLCCRQSVKNRVDIGTGIFEAHFSQLTAIHKLNPFPEFSFLETVTVEDMEFFIQNL